VGVPVVAGCDAPPVLDPSEDVFDLAALAVEFGVVVILHFAVLARRDARGDALRGERGAEPVAVIAFVSEQFLGAGKRGKQQCSAFVVAHLTFGQEHHDRPAQSVADGMELRVQAALGAPDTSGKSPPFNRLAAVRWALR
jgi:hypothetical protein